MSEFLTKQGDGAASCPSCPETTNAVAAPQHRHPDHTVHLRRLNRVKGQLEGIQGMIEARRYCPDIINQLKAAKAGIAAMEAEIFKTHLRACVRDAFTKSDSFQAETKIEEIMKMVF
jgi:DNA-binding FrmR family transcriptional regulator